jgi:outer membrane protein TolC
MRIILLLIAVGFVAGCVRFQDKPISAADSAAVLENRSLTNPTLKVVLETNLHRSFPDWPVREWQLDMLTLAAFYYQPNLEVARAQWRISQAEIKTAGGRPNPTLNLLPAYNFTPMGLNPWLPGVTLDIPIETAGKRGHRITRAQHLSDAARLNIISAAWRVRSDVRSSLVDCLSLYRRASLLEKQLASQQRWNGLVADRIRAGELSGSDASLASLALERTRLDLLDAQRLRAESRARLAEAIGLPVAAFEKISFSDEGLTTPASAASLTSADLRKQALLGRPDVLGALAEYAASQSALQLEVARQWPDIHLGPGYQWDQGGNKLTLGVSSEIPVLNQNQGPIAEAEAHRAESAARFLALQAKVIADLDRATEVFQASRQQLDGLQSLVDAQAKQLANIRAQYQAGAADQADRLTAEIEFNASELTRLEITTRLQQAQGALEDALQQPLAVPTNMLEAQQSNAH